MKRKFICNTLPELKYITEKYADFFDVILISSTKKHIKKGYTIYLFDNYGKISWCFTNSLGCKIIACNSFSNCETFKKVYIKRVLKINRINEKI